MSSVVVPALDLARQRGEVVCLSRTVIGAEYRLHAEECEPPNSFNCAVLVQWLLKSVRLVCPEPYPQLLLDLFRAGHRVEKPKLGDLVFCDFPSSKYHFPVGRGCAISHVGVFVGGGRVVHASALHRQVVCESFGDFCRGSIHNFREHVALPLSAQPLPPSVEEDLEVF